MKKRIISLVLAAVLVLSLTACGEQTADMGTSNSDLVYAMVSTTGSGYVAAAALADVINNNVDGLTVSCEVCGGLETLCQMIEAGEVDMANSATGIVYGTAGECRSISRRPCGCSRCIRHNTRYTIAPRHGRRQKQ